MKLYLLYATATHGEACELAKLLDRRAGVSGTLKVARPEPGILESPYRYMVLTTSETLAKNRELIDGVRAAVKPPRFPLLAKIGDRLFDALVDCLEALARHNRLC